MRSLGDYRDVPDRLWELYTASVDALDSLREKIEACPLLPEFVAFKEQQEREWRKAEATRLLAARAEAKRVKLAEETRRAGVLKPLLKGCPTDEPVRIE